MSPPDESSNRLSLDEAGRLEPTEVLARLQSGLTGLTPDEAEARIAEVGPNILSTRSVHASLVLIRQLRNPLLLLLLGAALLSGLTGGGTNAIIIAVIVALSVGLGFFNEYAAELAMTALRSKISQKAQVRRDARIVEVPVTQLVPGDIVALRIGAIVPADLRLLEVNQLECD